MAASVPKTDIESNETEPLLKNDVISQIEKEIIGGEPGDANFWTTIQLAIRGSLFSVFLALVVWENEHFTTGLVEGLDDYQQHMPLAICIIIFSIGRTTGKVMNGAGAAIFGVFIACANIFILRGFFPNGVSPGMHPFALEKVAAWTNLVIFNLVMLCVDCRPAVRIFAMSQNTNFILAFLNPDNVTVYSKNWTVNKNGAAVTAFVGISIGALLSVVAMLVPYPWCFAYGRMRGNAYKASADMAKMFMNVVKYGSGTSATVQIDRLYNQLTTLRKEITDLNADIDAAYNETWDLSSTGVVRCFMKKHSELLNELYDILYAMIIPLKVEDFGESHSKVMNDIREDCSELVNASAILLMTATGSSRHDTTAAEEKTLEEMEDAVKKATSKLAADFDQSRRSFQKPLNRELLSESAFAYALSAYGRHVVDYSAMLRTNKPQGATWMEAIEATFNAHSGVAPPTMAGVRFIARYMIGLMICFLFSVYWDNYSPACAMTAVFLLNDRPSPDVKGSLDLMLAIVVGSVVGTLLFSWSCRSGHGDAVLPFVFFFLLFPCIWVAQSRSSFSTIGFFIAALAPFSMVKACPSPELASSTHSAVGLWAGIRARSVAMFVLTVCEFMLMEKRHSLFAVDAYDNATKAVQTALASLWTGADPKPALDDASKGAGEALSFSMGAKVEPRFGACEWKTAFLADCCDVLASLRVDVLMIYRGMGVVEGKADNSEVLKASSGFKLVQEDLEKMLTTTREMSTSVLLHMRGEHTQLAAFECMSNIDKLGDIDKAIEDLNAHLKFPDAAPESMETDQICQVALMITMLELAKTHLASIVFSGMKYT